MKEEVPNRDINANRRLEC